MPSNPIPPPPRFLSVFFAAVAIICFVGGFALQHAPPLKTGGTGSLCDVQLLLNDQEGAQKLRDEYGKEGYQVSLRSVQSTKQIATGFIVVEAMEPVAGKSAAEALSQVYHFPVSLKKSKSDDKVQVQIGKIYKNEAEANQLSKKLESLGYHWHVRSHYTEKPGQAFEIVISKVPTTKAELLCNKLTQNGIQAKMI